MNTSHEKYMYRCLQLAQLGRVQAMPNPSVGAVVVYKDTIIGEGFTSKFGGAHAEVNAINSVNNQDVLSESTLYVSLEPCSHYGKTPPCCELIVEKRIKKVIIGCLDPFEKVAGKGIEYLKNNGVEVVVGVLEKECIDSHKRFFTFHTEKRPYVILKWAESTDGFIAPLEKNEQKPVWLSNTLSRQLAHKLRSEEAAILVGKNTVLQDNPRLTTRDWFGKNPVRFFIDQHNEISDKFHILNNEAKTIVITSKKIENCLSNIEYISMDFSQSLVKQILEFAWKNQLQSLIVEGGQKTLQSFIDEKLWDEALVFYSDVTLHDGISAPTLSHWQKIEQQKIKNDLLITYKKI